MRWKDWMQFFFFFKLTLLWFLFILKENFRKQILPMEKKAKTHFVSHFHFHCFYFPSICRVFNFYYNVEKQWKKPHGRRQITFQVFSSFLINWKLSLGIATTIWPSPWDESSPFPTNSYLQSNEIEFLLVAWYKTKTDNLTTRPVPLF